MAHLAFRSRKHVNEHLGNLGDLDVPAHKVQRTTERPGQPKAVEGAADGCALRIRLLHQAPLLKTALIRWCQYICCLQRA